MSQCLHENELSIEVGTGTIKFGKVAIWSYALSQIENVEGNICIATYSLPDIQFTQRILAKKTHGIRIIAHSKFFDRAYEIKEAFPEIDISLRDDIHAKFALIEPNTVCLLSANFGRSNWIEHAAVIHAQNVFDGFQKDFDKLFRNSEPVETLKPCPFCGTKLKLREGEFPALQEWGNELFSRKQYMITCPVCKANLTTTKPTLEEAIRVWNRRANHE